MSNLARVSIILVAGWLALIYGTGGLWPGTAASIALGCLWVLGREQRREESALAGLIASTSLATAGLSYDLPAWTMLLGVIGALVAWDLHLFAARLASAQRIEGGTTIIRLHLERLAIVAAVSLGLGGLSLGIELRLTMVWALGLGCLAVLILARILRQSR